MAARGEVDAAVTALREAVTAGWARPRVLERDEVLGVLRGVPGFDAVVADAWAAKVAGRKAARVRDEHGDAVTAAQMAAQMAAQVARGGVAAAGEWCGRGCGWGGRRAGGRFGFGGGSGAPTKKWGMWGAGGVPAVF